MCATQQEPSPRQPDAAPNPQWRRANKRRALAIVVLIHIALLTTVLLSRSPRPTLPKARDINVTSRQATTTLSSTKDATVTATTGTTAGTGTVAVTVGTLPDITIAQTSGSTPVQGQPVTFTITVTPGSATDLFQTIVVNFGDGTSSPPLGGASTTVSHTYNSANTYTVTATGTTAGGDTKSNSTIITITPRGVVNVTIAKDPNTATVNKNTPITFTATVTPSTGIQSYSWDYGDGNGCNGCSSQVSHAYANATGSTATFTVTVTVKTTDGNSGTGQTQVVINP